MDGRRLEMIAFAGALAWATLAFGGVYPWAYTPAYLVAGAAGLHRLWRNRSNLDRTWTVVVGGGVLALVAVAGQLVPIPATWANALSPNLTPLLGQYDLRYATAGQEPAWLTLSIQPAQTFRAWWCGIALTAVLAGLAAEFRNAELRLLLRVIVALGVVMTMAGAVQRATGTALVYGFWVPEAGARPFQPVGGPFGPFVNRNHFAGWMLLAIPLGLAYFVQCVKWSRVPPDLRRRLLWLQTAEGTEALWTGAAVGLMALGLMLTLSRSGIAVFGAMLGAALLIGLCRRGTRLKALGAATLVAVVVGGLVVRAGSDLLLTRFERASRDFAGRQRTWSDAVRIFSDFTITGTGTNTYDQATLFYEPPGLEAHYAQAHNDYLQLLAESGVVGAFTFAVLVAAIGWASWRRLAGATPYSRVLRAGGLAGLAALALQEAVDFSLHMPANALLAVLAIGVAVAPNAANDAPVGRPGRGR